MVKELTPPWWARWLPSAARKLVISGTGVEIHTREGIQSFDWTAISQHPRRSPIWFLHMAYINTPRGSWRLYFRTQPQQDAAWKELVRAWYIPRIIETQRRLKSFDDGLQDSRYLRTSVWEPYRQQVLSWANTRPPVPPEGILRQDHRNLLIRMLELTKNPDGWLKESRDSYVAQALIDHHDLFETVESDPLTPEQRKACVIDEDNNLILAGAGTGKTSTVIGRVAFLVASEQAKPEEILLLAYGQKAALELRERLESKLGIKGVTAETFHRLGRCIVKAADKKAIAISDMAGDEDLTANFVDQVFQDNQQEPEYRALLLNYFERWLHPARNPFDFKTLGDYYRFLEDNHIRTLKGEAVKGFGECDIANFLFKNGIEYRYEATYPTPLQSPDRAAYRPDFFLPELGIYIEHFGTDRQGNTAPYIDREKYQADMAWKRNVHAQGGTTLIETFHYEKQEGALLKLLEQRLVKAGVVLNPLPPEAVLETLREFGAISDFSKILAQMLGLVRAANLSAQQQADLIARSANPGQVSAALTLLDPIKSAYVEALRSKEEMDFDDMINMANEYVLNDRFESPWKFIVVDEFQDIAKSRAELVQALRKSRGDVSLFCVGDDWQSIFRFTGSDISFTADFEKIFGATQFSKLNKTFRFNSKIGEVASRFIMQNSRQITKDIQSHTIVASPTVSLVRASLAGDAAIDQVLDGTVARISAIAKPGSTVYLLARFKFHLPDLDAIRARYSNLVFKQDSIHSSKGKEADYVIILGLGKGKYGLPSEIVTHPLIDALQPKAEAFPHAEERRLFYVALTRAKHRVYLICDMMRSSPFVRELIDGKYPLDLEELAASPEQVNAIATNCPACKEGFLVNRVNRTTGEPFIGCSNYLPCRHIEAGCDWCDAPMTVSGRYRICVSPKCKRWLAMCPVSGGHMVFRKKFNTWGCSHYRVGGLSSCGHMEKHIAPPPPKPSN
ncbi:UvrD-helicase domain-containing protein [Pseudomonas viridiflava]|uniref:UvrD-helicase domain-containing protein n=1 Tax=Pseudomonas viridiflava TaxID=33069 RepID=UPI000F02A895|nr:UvrD-helicase domain-containing protein [Pseudomonas viridiflava]